MTTWRLVEGVPPLELTPLQGEVLAAIRDSGGSLTETKTKRLPSATARVLRLLEMKGLVVQVREAVPLPAPKAEQGLLRLSTDSDRIEDFLKREGKKKPAQALTLMRLQTAGQPALSRDEIKALCGVTDQTLKALVTAGFLDSFMDAVRERKTPPTPNPHPNSSPASSNNAANNGNPPNSPNSKPQAKNRRKTGERNTPNPRHPSPPTSHPSPTTGAGRACNKSEPSN